MPIKNRLGAKTGETNVFMVKRSARTKTGGRRSAAYQRGGIRTRRIREERFCRPALPSTILVKTTLTTEGPRSMAGNIIRPPNFRIGSPPRGGGGATAEGAQHRPPNGG